MFAAPVVQVLRWRSTAEKLKRFETSCSNIVLSMLHALVMKAVYTLKEGMKRSIKEAVTLMQQQMESFQKMLKETVSQPYSQTVLDRIMIHANEKEEDDKVDEVHLTELQANSFTALVSDVSMGESYV